MRSSLKWLSAAALTLVMSEFGACVVLKDWHPSGVLDVDAPAATGIADVPDESRADRVRRRLLRGEHIHPYLGFMHPEVDEDRPESVVSLNQPELYEPGSPLFSEDPTDLIVGVAGGSVAEQFTRVAGGETLAAQLTDQPHFAGRRVRFVALATSGAKQPHQLMALEYLLVQGGRLDLLLNLDGFNEIALHEWENERYGVAPIYPRLWRTRVERLNTASLYGEREYVEGLRAERAHSLLASRIRVSSLRQLAWALGDRTFRRKLESVEERIRSYGSEGTLDFVTQGPRQPDATYGLRQATLVDIWRRSSWQMHQTCLANGIEYYHFLQPNQYLAGSKPMSEEETKIAIKEGQPYGQHVPTGYPRLQSAGAELYGQGVRFHDLSAVFENHREILYKDTCCHLNAEGNSILARAIAAAIESWQ